MIKNIIGNIIEVEWNNPVEGLKFEGDDLWGFDETGNVCSLILVLTGKDETGSDFLKVENSSQSANSSNCELKFEFGQSNPESKRQYFFNDNVLFDYRKNAARFDLNELKSKNLNSSVTGYFNESCDLQFLLLSDLHSFSFYPNSQKEDAVKLLDLEISLRKEVWNFYIMSCLYQYDCSLEEYKKAVVNGEQLIESNKLPYSIIKYIKTHIEFWNEVIEDEFS